MITRELNSKGLNLIKRFEGVVPFVYLCQAGKPTIGCGHLCIEGDSYLKGCSIDEIIDMISIKPMEFEIDNYSVLSNDVVKDMTTITNKEIDTLLKKDVLNSCKAVEALIDVELNDNQFAALVSFTFNLGRTRLRRSTLRKKLNLGEYDAVPNELNRWVCAGGKRLRGLIKRREAEGKLFMTE